VAAEVSPVSKLHPALIAGAFALVAAAGIGQAQGTRALTADERPLAIKADHPGRTAFEHHCAPCHAAGPGDDGAAMLPGTATLARRYEGRLPGALELRTDINVDTLHYFVRNGAGAMPPFRKAELTDTQIDQIAGYLEATAKANANR
jgi:mono/diheme cytochrome c family protein